MRKILLFPLVGLTIFAAIGWGLVASNAEARPILVQAQIQIPVIQEFYVGCTTNRSWVNVKLITPPGQNRTDHVVHIQYWFEGVWRDTPTISEVAGGLLVQGRWGRLRGYIDTAWQMTEYWVVGPPAGPFGDLCYPVVDSYRTNGDT